MSNTNKTNEVWCFCVPAPKSEIYRDGDVVAYACDGDGNTLAQHYSSSGFSMGDIVSSVHQEKYAKRYPEGYQCVWVNEPPKNWNAPADYKPAEKWLVWSNEHGAWWAPERLGYTKDRNRAGTYSYEDATEIVRNANQFIPGNLPPNEAMVPAN